MWERVYQIQSWAVARNVGNLVEFVGIYARIHAILVQIVQRHLVLRQFGLNASADIVKD